MSEPLHFAPGVIYEVDLEVDAELTAAFDTWLRDHIADMLQLPGFLSAEILGDAAETPGRSRRIVQYRLRDQPALDAYLRDHAERMRAPGLARFGERFAARRRVLPHREEFIRGAISTENCLNCGEVLTGQHCSHCGQRARVRVLSMWSMLREMLGDLTNFDSRLWRTLLPLAFRPGLLTQDYLRGKRVGYTPPFRMYLIFSVVFFLIASVEDPGGALDLTIDGDGTSLTIAPEPDAAGTPPPPPGAPAPEAGAGADAGAQAKLDNAAVRIVDGIIEKLPPGERAKARADLQRDLADVSKENLAAVERIAQDPCGETPLKIDGAPGLDRYTPRLREACRKIMADKQSFGRALFDNIPKMMFIFLPLIAGIMAVLYLGSGRYYVEHLLFFVHFHAFFFFVGIVLVALEVAGDHARGALQQWLNSGTNVLETVLLFYIPWYLYRAMRRVYGQGRIVTLAKYSVLGVAYVVSLTLTGIGLLFYTALSL